MTTLSTRLFDVDEYHAMTTKVGILPEDPSHELIGGRVYVRATGRPRLFRPDEYHAMVGANIITSDAHLDMADGEILESSSVSPSHASCVMMMTELFMVRLEQRAGVSCQNPVRLDRYNEIQPDVTLLKWRDDFYSSGHPGPADVLLLIEVSDTTLSYDRNVKLPMYAQFDIPEFWIVNIPDGVVEVYTDPSDGEYRTRRLHAADDTVGPAAFPDVTLSVSRIVPA